jgi:hypothetical protein
MNSRRDALKALAVASAATAASQAQHSHEPGALTKITAPKVQFFSVEEFRALTKLVDLIIPRTDTPGASDAGVHYLIDETVFSRAPLQKQWRAGLKLLIPRADAEWTALLTKWSREKNTAGSRFFEMAKGAVVDLYYSTREGLTTELGWHGNTFLAKFDGCTHPEHKS